MQLTLKDVFDWYYENLPMRSLKFQLGVLKNITKNMFGVEIKLETPNNDRDLIECIQEVYSFIYCVLNEIEYSSFRVTSKIIEENKYFNWIADYKIEHFADEIFSEFGIEVVEKRKDGFVVKDKNGCKVYN